MATYPGGVFTRALISNGQTSDAANVNELQDEITAIEGGLLNGTAPLNSSKSTLASLQVSGGSTLAGTLSAGASTLVSLQVTGGSTLSGVTLTGNASIQSVQVNGNSTFSGPVHFEGAFSLSGVISPAALSSGDTPDYFPTGSSVSCAIRLTGAAGGSTLTGLGDASAGRTKLLINIGATAIGIANSTTANTNEFLMKSGNSTTLALNATMLLWYDITTARWRQM